MLTWNATAIDQAIAKSQALFELAEPSFIHVATGKADVWVLGIAQSDSGLIWVATANGVFHFDGYDYKAMDYFNADGKRLDQQYIFSISRGENGVMWAGTVLKGLVRIDERRRRFEVYAHDPNNPDSIGSDQVYDVLADGDVGLWVATKTGLDYFDFALSKFHHHELPHADKTVRSINWSSDGNLLLGTTNGIYHYDVKNHQAKLISDDGSGDLKGQVIRAITPDEEGRVWIGTFNSGAFLLQTDGELARVGNYDQIYSIQILDDEVWMATNSHGIAVFDYQTGRLKREYSADSYRPMALGNNFISSLFLDESGVVWVGGWGAGIWTVAPSRVSSRTLLYSPSKQSPSLKTDVSGVLETDEGENLGCQSKPGD